MKERVQKLMAQANIGSRRACEELIRQGRVRVNGQTIHLGDQADPDTDVIDVDGEKLKFETTFKRYFAINKPLNVLSSNASTYDDERTPVRDLIPYEGHLFSIGRLDAESDGLMVLTNDGEMTNQLTHPRYQHTKTYKVVVYGSPTQATLDTWEQGVYLEEGLTAPCSIRVQQREAEVTVLKIVMIEGKKRQIRRVAAQLGHPVKRLTRTHIGKLELGKLKQGDWYELNEEEVKLMTTPASDLTYIKRLRKQQREQRKKDFVQRARETSSPADAPLPTREKPARSDARPAARPGSRPVRLSSDRSAGNTRPTTRNVRGKPGSGSSRTAGDTDEGERSPERPAGRAGDRYKTRSDRVDRANNADRADRPDRTDRRRDERGRDRTGDSKETPGGDHPSGDRPFNDDRPKRKPVSRKPGTGRPASGGKPRSGSGKPGSGKPGAGRPASRKPGSGSGGNRSSGSGGHSGDRGKSRTPRKGRQ